MKIFLLFLIQLVWAGSYVSQKMALAEIPLGLILILRYAIATLFFLFAGCLKINKNFSLKEWLLIFFVGVLNFSFSPYFQLKALSLTYAMDVSVLIAFEPLITAVLAFFFLKERLTRSTLWTFLIATAGVLMMAVSKDAGGSFQWFRLAGDLFFLGSLICEGINSITSRALSQKSPPLQLVAWLIFAGFLANLLRNFPLLTLHNIQAISIVGWINVFYLALFCSVLAYGVWVYLLKRISVNPIALSLFLQPVLGSCIAVWILKERFDLQMLLGSLLVVLSLGVWLTKHLKKWAAHRNIPDTTPQNAQSLP